MVHEVRSHLKFLAISVIVLSSTLAFGSSAKKNSQDEEAAKSAGVASQSIEGQSSTLLPDGRLLLTGGIESGKIVNSAAFQNVQSGKSTKVSGSLLQARAFHSATLLPTGKVLVFGGTGNGTAALSLGELFDPVTQSFTGIALNGLMLRSHHTATLLTDGRVLIAGGLNAQGKAIGQIQVWDSRTGQATTLAISLNKPRSGHSATLLADGTVLLSGGQDENGIPLNYGEIVDANVPSVRFVWRLPGQLKALEPPSLAASIPQNGESGIPTDEVISLRFSEALDVTSLNSSTVTLKTSLGDPVIAAVVPAESGMLAFITPQDYLQNGTTYKLSISGAADKAGRALPSMTIIFTTALADDSVAAGGDNGSTTSGSTGSLEGWAIPPAPTGLTSPWRNLPVLKSQKGVTALAGQVLTLDGSPLPNVLLKIDSEHATTDKTGRFLISGIGSGHHVMIIDGAPASDKANVYGIYRAGVDLKAGQTNSLNYTIWMTALDTEDVVTIPSPTTSDMVITTPKIPGLELHIPAGTVIHNVYGQVVTQLGITPIPTKQPPFPLKKGVQFPVYFTIQPGGASFKSLKGVSSAGNNRGVGATIHYVNLYKGKPGDRFEFWNYDPSQKGWYMYGHGRVTADGKMINPEPGTQIWSFDGAMLGIQSLAAAIGRLLGNPTAGEPVDLQTGLFLYTKTDLVENDVIPLALTRKYRQGDYGSRDFGIGTNMPYDMFLVGDSDSSPEGYTYIDLILADGAKIHFTRTSPCTGANGYCDYPDAVYTATSTPSEFYGATIYWSGNGGPNYWILTTKDGTVLDFPDGNGSSARQAALTGIQDRYGNAVTFTRDQNFLNLLQVMSPNGRWIKFTYDSSNRVTGALDSAGRTTSYTYNTAGYLQTATDANGGVTTYTYDADGNMTAIQDPRQIVYLQNQYNDNDMVSLQTQADGSTYQFAYTLDDEGNVTQTNVTDPRGYVRQVTFNSDGYMASDTRAVGKPEQQAVNYNRQQGTGLPLSMTDALSRTTTYSYDAMGDATSITRLAGTSNAVTTSLSYDPRFYEVSSVTDPLGNSTTLAYDTSGNMLSVTDPLGNARTFTYNSAGQPTAFTDPQGNQTQFTYNAGDLVSATDALGRTVSRFVDAAGRVAAISDPLGHTTRAVFDPLNEVTSTIDPLGNQTSFTYDGNGNRLTVTDANQHTTSYTYDNLDRPITRKDPLGNQASVQYDLNGNLIQFTDRKGQVTTYTYDGLNRPTLVHFNDANTITNTFDAGNRLTGIVDSQSGTISRSHDGLDRLLSEATPQGSVAYTYDADGRRLTMNVSGQSQVNYAFDNGSHLTSIAQGASNILFGYDTDGRRTSLTLPNGVVAIYSYDSASQLIGIVYQGGSLLPSNLEYSYDLAGRQIGVSGSLASTQLPTAVSSTVYNANNQLTQWGSTAMTYDANGNTLNDGTNSYVWDARNRLASANSNGATFAYDPLGRRVGKTILSVNTNFLYDGVNPVQELNGATVTGNLLTGGVDERFTRTTATETDNYLTDALGSTVALAGSTGNSQAQYSYSPYGSMSITGSTTNSYGFTGRETDGLGVNYYRARYFNPNTGRFLSEDPIGFAGSGPNLYAYVSDDPMDFIDPFGTDKRSIGNKILDAWLALTSPIDKGATWADNHQSVVFPLAIMGAVEGNEGPIEEDEALLEETVTSGFGTTEFGTTTHAQFGDVLLEQTGTLANEWDFAAPNAPGVDATYLGSQDLGFNAAELKPVGYDMNAVGNQIGSFSTQPGRTSVWWYNSNGIIGNTGWTF